MRIKIVPVANYPNVLNIQLSGAWSSHVNFNVMDMVAEHNPSHMIVDVSQVMVSSEVLRPVDQGSIERWHSMTAFAEYLKIKPDMCYVLVDPNETGIFDTTLSFYQEAGAGNQVATATSLMDALLIIRVHETRRQATSHRK